MNIDVRSLREGAMKLVRRKFLHLAACSRAAGRLARPSKPIIVPYAAGGVTSVVGQIVAERMRKALGQPIIVENVGGTDGSIGAGRAARARSDLLYDQHRYDLERCADL